jgi:hypothetical protein
MDPAALGTALIGLEAIRRRETVAEWAPRPRPVRRGSPARAAFAAFLRALAASIEPRPPEPARNA